MQGKKRYLVIALFLLLGLTTFTFANPKEDLGTQKESGNETISNDKKANNSYTEALEAVEKAEADPTTENVQNARNELETANDATVEQVQQLQNRVNVVKNSVDVAALVGELETLAGVKETIPTAKEKYSNVETEVNKLAEGEVKNNLAARLANVSKIINDTTAPGYTGIKNNQITNQDVTVVVADETSVTTTVTLNNETVDFSDAFTKEGVYVLTFVDEAFNTETVTFTIDKTAAKVKAANILVNGDSNENKVFYATNEDKIYAYIRVDEKLAELPTFTFHNNGKDYVASDVVEGKPNAKGEYTYSVLYEINENVDMADGQVTLTVSNIKDAAGNETANVTKPTNGHEVYLDRTAPARVYSTVRVNKTEYNENGTKYYYVKNGDSFEFAISFNELLAEVPTVTIGGRKVEMKLNEKVLENENKFLYEGTFKIAENEKELKQGTLEIKVSNVKDVLENEATDNTVTDQTRTSNGRTVIYDCKNPVVTGVNNNYHYNTPITIKAVDYIVHNVSPIATATIDGEDYEMGTKYGKEGTHEFVAYDRAGNRLRVTFTIDYTVPTLTVKEDSVGVDPYYNKVSFKLSDNVAIDYFVINGEKIDRTDAKWSDANYQNIKKHLVAGENTIVLYDTTGNKTSKTFYMDWTAPTVEVKSWVGNNPYSGASFKLKDNYAIDYFVLNGKKHDRTNAKSSDANYNNIKGSLVDGENTLVLYDAAGNSTTYIFTLDRKAPTLEITKSAKKVYVRSTDEAEINFNVYKGEELILEVDSKTFAGGKYFSIDWLGNGEYTIEATDYAGNKTTATAVVDGTYYITNEATLKAAFTESGSYVVTNDITTTSNTSVVVQENIEAALNLNGHKIINKVVGAPALVNNGTLTIIGNGSIINGTNSQKASHTIVNKGTLVIESGNIGTEDTAGAAVLNYGTTTINGGTFASKQENKKGDGLCAYVFINQTGTMTINNATVDGQTHGLFGAYDGKLIVNGGNYTLDGNNGLGCYIAYSNGKGKVILNSGTINTNNPRNNRYFFVYAGEKNYFNEKATNTGWVVADKANIYLNGEKLPY